MINWIYDHINVDRYDRLGICELNRYIYIYAWLSNIYNPFMSYNECDNEYVFRMGDL